MRYDRIGRQSPVPYARLCLCAFLVLLLWTGAGLATACFGAGGNFCDVGAWQWHAAAVERARAEGILEGYPDGTFRPDRTVSCGEFLRMAVPEAPKTSAAHWAGRYYQEGLRRQLFTEGDIRESALDRPLARKYMALVYSRLLEETDPGLTGIQIARTEEGTVPSAPFSDVDERSAYEYPIALAAAAGLLKGYPDGTFRPDGFLTRAEAATAFVRLLDLWDGSAAAGGPPSEESEPPADPAEPDPAIADLADPVCLAYLDALLASVRFEGSAGNYRYRFSAPAVAAGYKNFISVSFFSPTGKQILTDYKHWSRNPAAHSVEKYMVSMNTLSQIGTVHMEFAMTNLTDMNWVSYTLRREVDQSNNLRIQYINSKTGKIYTEHYLDSFESSFVWE